MKHALALPIVLLMVATTSLGHAEEYTIILQSNGKEVAVVELAITEDTAIAKCADSTERFDLTNRRWQHDESKQWVTLTDCETWAKQSREKSRKSVTSAPEQIQRFVAWCLDPKFEVKSTDDALKMTSGFVDYSIVVEKSDGDVTNYYRYAKLNAYKKAMTEKKIPPFAELIVLEELERRKLLPKSMEVNIPGIPEAPSLKVILSNKSKTVDK